MPNTVTNNKTSQSLKVLWKDLKRSPGILFAIVLIIGVILYTIYKQNNQGADTSNTSNEPAYHLIEVSVTPPASNDNQGSGGITDKPPKSQLVTTTTGWLATTPGGTNNKGQNILNLPKGAVLDLLSGPVSFGKNKYYKVTYNGKTGYVNSKTVGL